MIYFATQIVQYTLTDIAPQTPTGKTKCAPPGVEPGELAPKASMLPLHHSATTMGVRGIEPRLWRSHHQVLAITLHSPRACDMPSRLRCLYTATCVGAVRVGVPVSRPFALTVGPQLAPKVTSAKAHAFFLPSWAQGGATCNLQFDLRSRLRSRGEGS